MEWLAEWSYDIDISKTGMKRVTTTTTTKDGEVTTYDADLLPQTGTIKATVERYVKTKAGELIKKDTPIIDADVVVSDEKWTTLITSAKSDTKSEATVEEIAVWTYSIQAKKAGFESVIPSVISVVDSMVTSPVLKLIELWAKIMNMVFDDTNGDGKQSEQELWLEGTTVDLLDKDWAIVSTTQTTKDWSYSFDLEPGDYTIRVKAPLGYTFTTNEPQKITIAEWTVQGKTNGHGLKIAQAVWWSTFYDVYVSVLPVSSPAPAPTPTHSVADTQKEALPLEWPTNNEDEATNEWDQATSPYQWGGGATNEWEPSVQYEFESNESSLTHPASLPDTGADVE